MHREIGTALAVLAIYVLTLLAPLHQARASQLVFEAAGYTTLTASWVVCVPAGADGSERGETIAKCPACGTAKSGFLAPLPPVAPMAFSLQARRAMPPPPAPLIRAASFVPPVGSRAPPAWV